MCHLEPPARNAYGVQMEGVLLVGSPRPLSDADFLEGLAEALDEVADLDADGDGVSNLDELMAGAAPGDARSVPQGTQVCPKPPEVGHGWDVCNYDERYVFKKLSLDFCGQSPTWDEMAAFDAREDKMVALHEALDACLVSEYWIGREGVVWNLANSKILPVASIKSGPDEPGPIPLADYLDDYNYFVYTHTGDRDVREVLTGDYFVEREDGQPTVYTPFQRTPLQDYNVRGADGAQAVSKNRRAGMITHRWFLMSNTMFTAMPRTTAAQAYRAYLGFDISRLEGLQDVPGEPVDYDNKGVKADACARCHATLDPLTYPFSRYEGIGGSSENYLPFSYSSNRMRGFTHTDGELVAETPEEGWLLGQRVSNLIEWAEVAANSEPFAQTVVRDYWTLVMGSRPLDNEQDEFEQLWMGLMGENEYQVQRMLHDLIETEAYGVP